MAHLGRLAVLKMGRRLRKDKAMPARNPSRHYARSEPRPLSALCRVQLAGRLAATEQALGLLLDQAAQDGGEAPQALGALKVQAVTLRNRIRELDSAAGCCAPLPLAVALAMAGRRTAE